jgi:hypothetical protein
VDHDVLRLRPMEGARAEGAPNERLLRGTLAVAGAWMALAVLGQAAALQLVVAGTSLHYQHLLPWPALVRTPAAAIVLTQGLLVVWALRARVAGLGEARITRVTTWIGRELGAWRAAMLFVALVLSSATLSRDVVAYAGELVAATLIQLISLGTVVLAVASLPAHSLASIREWAGRVLGTGDGVPDQGGVDRFALGAAAFVTIVCALLSVFVYERHPHVQDEVKYLYHARYFAAGMLAMPAPPVPQAFQLYLLDVGPHGWYSVVPPGWPAMLAVGAKVGLAWLVNPVLSGVNVLLAYLLLRAMYDLRTARLATLLLAVSPWYLFLGMGYMAHAGTLACALLGALGVERARRTGGAQWALLGGFAVGFASLIRQLDGLIVALLLGLWSIGFGGKRLKLSGVAALVIGTALGAAITFPYNAYFTGKASAFPIMTYNDRLFGVNSNAYGFGPDRGMGWELDPNPGHGPLDATINANLNTTALSVELFGWSVGSLLLIYFLVARERWSRSDRAMLAAIVAVFGAYFFNYFSGGPDFGARYWFLMVLPAVALTARGALSLGSRLEDGAPAGAGFGTSRVLAALGVLSAGALVAFMPWRSLDKYRHYLDMRPDVRVMAEARGFGKSLVLVRGVEYPDYASAAIYNPLDLRADAPVYVHDRDAATRRAILEAYRDRPVWIVDGPTITKHGYRIVSGPTPAAELLAAEGAR